MFAAKGLLFAGFASTVLAFQQAGDPNACVPSEACSYTYTGIDSTGLEVTVTAAGNCNAQGQCLGNGAVCENDDQCYNFCSATTGTCGGVGAECYSRNADVEYGGLYVVCDTPGSSCSVDCDDVNFENCPEQGTCLLAASQAARFRKARRSEADVETQNLQMMLRRAAKAVAQPGDEASA